MASATRQVLSYLNSLRFVSQLVLLFLSLSLSSFFKPSPSPTLSDALFRIYDALQTQAPSDIGVVEKRTFYHLTSQVLFQHPGQTLTQTFCQIVNRVLALNPSLIKSIYSDMLVKMFLKIFQHPLGAITDANISAFRTLVLRSDPKDCTGLIDFGCYATLFRLISSPRPTVPALAVTLLAAVAQQQALSITNNEPHPALLAVVRCNGFQGLLDHFNKEEHSVDEKIYAARLCCSLLVNLPVGRPLDTMLRFLVDRLKEAAVDDERTAIIAALLYVANVPGFFSSFQHSSYIVPPLFNTLHLPYPSPSPLLLLPSSSEKHQLLTSSGLLPSLLPLLHSADSNLLQTTLRFLTCLSESGDAALSVALTDALTPDDTLSRLITHADETVRVLAEDLGRKLREAHESHSAPHAAEEDEAQSRELRDKLLQLLPATEPMFASTPFLPFDSSSSSLSFFFVVLFFLLS
jgi:hypothetical protein